MKQSTGNLTKAMAILQKMAARNWLNKEGFGGTRIHAKSVVTLYEHVTARVRCLTDEELRFANAMASLPETSSCSETFGEVTANFYPGRITGKVYGARERDGVRYLRVLCDGVWDLVELHQIVSWQAIPGWKCIGDNSPATVYATA